MHNNENNTETSAEDNASASENDALHMDDVIDEVPYEQIHNSGAAGSLDDRFAELENELNEAKATV
jgi:hypothetical protein